MKKKSKVVLILTLDKYYNDKQLKLVKEFLTGILIHGQLGPRDAVGSISDEEYEMLDNLRYGIETGTIKE